MAYARLVAAGLAVFALTSCSAKNSQNQYDYSEVGKSKVVERATVASVREVQVRGQNSGAGTVLGGAAGGIGGNMAGSGWGQVASVVAGAAVGAVAGSAAEQAAADYTALEYTLVKWSGERVSIVQNRAEGEPVFKEGDTVLLQSSGSYQRVLPDDGK